MHISLINAVLGYDEAPVLSVPRFELHTGRVTAIIGLNGSGKSTLFKSIVGLADILTGKLTTNDDVASSVPSTDRLDIWYTPQHNYLFDGLTVREHAELLRAGRSGSNRALHLEADTVKLEGLGWDISTSKDVSALSGGEKKIIALALALLCERPFILLDEPSAGIAHSLAGRLMDDLTREARHRQIGLGLIEHRLDLVEKIADDVYIASNGVLRGPFNGPEAVGLVSLT